MLQGLTLVLIHLLVSKNLISNLEVRYPRCVSQITTTTSTNTTLHNAEFTVRYLPRTTSQGIITH